MKFVVYLLWFEIDFIYTETSHFDHHHRQIPIKMKSERAFGEKKAEFDVLKL